MEKSIQIGPYLSSEDVARILSVNVATVKRWTDLGKLDCIKTAGGHRKFRLRHLAAFVLEHKKYSEHLSLLSTTGPIDFDLNTQVLKGAFDKLIPLFLSKVIVCEYGMIQNILHNLYMVHQDLALIYDELLTPVLHQIGDMWAKGELSVAQEHLASQAIRDGIVKLQDVVIKTDTNAGRAFVLTIGTELHDIPAKMVQHLLESRGFITLFSGQATPAGETGKVFESFHPDRVYLSSTYIENIEMAQQEFNELAARCDQYEARLFCGGVGMNQLTLGQKTHIKRLTSFKEVQSS
jgi:methanogenic corrinoid protein MtbC1